jgi:hypothetical protein
MPNTITAWSISRLFEFEKCPHSSYLRHIVKSPQPELPEDHPMLRGSRIHKEVEQYINGETDDFPSSGKKMRDVLDYCKEAYNKGEASVEEQWGFDSDWSPVGWFDNSVWLRAATDCSIVRDDTAEIFDWKTGKSFGNEVKYMQQMQLYGVCAFMLYPEVDYLDVTLGFLDDGKQRTKGFERGAKVNKLIARFTERGNRMTNCVDFRPKPNAMNCKYCPFGPGGTNVCMYGVSPL